MDWCAKLLASLSTDPLQAVETLYPWGQGALSGHPGPDTWQAEVLSQLGAEIRARESGEKQGAIRMLVKSGHNVGKGALCAWLILWFLLTRKSCRIVVTANTATQLETKTWAELKKWWNLNHFRHRIIVKDTKAFAKDSPSARADAIPWSIERPEAFQGTHEDYVLVIFDEASAIDRCIFDAVDLSLSGKVNIFLVLGNPTRAVGRFYELAHSPRWQVYTVNSLTARIPDKAELKGIIEEYGESSDLVRVRVYGEFPAGGDLQLIPWSIIESAYNREPNRSDAGHLVLGLDVARGGGALSVLTARTGTEVLFQISYDVKDLMQLANLVSSELSRREYRVLFVDSTGVGAGVYDRLVQLGWRNIFPVESGSQADDNRKYANKRAEMWGRMKDWLATIGRIPKDCPQLREQLGSVEYGLDKQNRIRLEGKDIMLRKGIKSPDFADSLALTFAANVPMISPRRTQHIRQEMAEL